MCRAVTRIPIISKLGPAVTDIVEMAAAAMEGGADALCIGNTYPAMSIDIDTQRPVLGFTSGGFRDPPSGPWSCASFGRSSRNWARRSSAAEESKAPGTPSSTSWQARAPSRSARPTSTTRWSCRRIIEGIRDYLAGRGLSCVEDIIGAAHAAKPELYYPGVEAH